MYECYLKVCERKGKEFKNTKFFSEEQYEKCLKCGNSMFKGNPIIQNTYNQICVNFAEQFNEKLLKKK